MGQAYTLLLWEKLPGGKLRLNQQHLKRGMEIATSVKAAKHLQSELVTYQFALTLANLPQIQREKSLETCVSSRWLQAFSVNSRWSVICDNAYEVFADLREIKEGAPSALWDRWKQDWEAIKGEQWKNNAQEPTASVAGTTWVVTDPEGAYDYYFQADGALHYKSPTGFWKNGTWKQDGNAIYMETNDKFAEFQARIVGTTRMEGKACNNNGRQWTWVAAKK